MSLRPHHKRRGRPRNPYINAVISLRLDLDLELQLEHWRSLQPTLPSRSRAIRVLMRKGLAAAEKECADGFTERD
jgi:hypothetical protein